MMNELNFFIYIILIMDFMLMLMMLIPSNLYKFHPLILSLLLILYIIVISFKLNFLMSTYWYSYIIFLVMIGGLMVLFMYFTSLSNNQLFYFNLNYYLYMFMKIFMLLLMIYLFNYYFNIFNNLLYNEFYELKNNMMMFNNYENNIYKSSMMDYCLDLNLYMIVYLFFTMVCSVLICTKILIPLRQLKN